MKFMAAEKIPKIQYFSFNSQKIEYFRLWWTLVGLTKTIPDSIFKDFRLENPWLQWIWTHDLSDSE